MSLKKNSIMFQKHFKIFVGEKFDIHWTFREYKFGLKVTLGLHSGYIQVTFKSHSSHIQVTIKSHSAHINLFTAPKISDLNF